MGKMTKTHRPKDFKEVIGQEVAVRLLKAVALNPENSATSIVITGPWGTGKTTLARIFGRALSCENFKKTGTVCMKCSGCQNFELSSNRYIEYDSSMVGNVNQIKELRPIFEMDTTFYRVIVLDEAHLISRQAQSSMLKVIEEGPEKTFYILCSTDAKGILDTIHSRSLIVNLYKIPNTSMKDHLVDIYEKETSKTDLTSEILDKLVFKADGHARDAVMLLESYMISGDKAILEIPVDDIHEFFWLLAQKDKEGAIKMITKGIMKHPIHQIQKSLNYVVMQLVATSVTRSENTYTDTVRVLGMHVFYLFKMVSESWSQGVFTDKYLTASFFLTIVQKFG